MSLLLVFAALAVVGQAVNFTVAVQLERMVSETAGLIAFFGMLPVLFIVAWKLAIRLTEPAAERHTAQQRIG